MSGQFGTGAEVSYGQCLMDTSALVPKCLGSEVSWVRSVLTPWLVGSGWGLVLGLWLTNMLCNCWVYEASSRPSMTRSKSGVKTLRTQDTSDPRHFGTSAEVSVRHFGTSAEVSGQFGTRAEMSYGHFGTKEDTWHSATLDGKVDECLCNTANYRRVQQLYTPISTRRMLA